MILKYWYGIPGRPNTAHCCDGASAGPYATNGFMPQPFGMKAAFLSAEVTVDGATVGTEDGATVGTGWMGGSDGREMAERWRRDGGVMRGR
jgi:hypothetical protein